MLIINNWIIFKIILFEFVKYDFMQELIQISFTSLALLKIIYEFYYKMDYIYY